MSKNDEFCIKTMNVVLKARNCVLKTRNVADDEDEPSPDLVCPISSEIMVDPVVTATGSTYEREHITCWLRTHSTDPLTNEQLRSKQLVPNLALRSLAATWIEQHPACVSPRKVRYTYF